jgi:CRISPR-associated protein Csm5
MTYRVTCLTPSLVGDGQRLSPIDYMVWKDHVNVLDQRRIFKLLAKGPRLDSYLAQLKKADKLDFASWGGFAQNFAGRRIPFEHPTMTAYWQRAHAENLFIPTFAAGPRGPYLPATSIKGALRTGAIFKKWSHATIEDANRRLESDRMYRRVSAQAENAALGSSGSDRMKMIAAADSAPVANAVMKVYLLRVSTLQARGGGKFETGWKVSPRGAVSGQKADDSTPVFAEMAEPGTVFEGGWTRNAFLETPEIARLLHWKAGGVEEILRSANDYAQAQLQAHAAYAATAGLPALGAAVEGLLERLGEVRQTGNSCLLSIGWGGGFFSKVSYLDTQDDAYRQVLRNLPFYSRAIQTGLPFPKTRRIVFLENRPATLPGWVRLELA